MNIATDYETRTALGIQDAVRAALEFVDRRTYSTAVATRARDAGNLWVPTDVRVADEWLRQGFRSELISIAAELGAVVLYTDGTQIARGRYKGQPRIVRIGVVVQKKPVPMAVEGDAPSLWKSEDPPLQQLRPIDAAQVACYVKPQLVW